MRVDLLRFLLLVFVLVAGLPLATHAQSFPGLPMSVHSADEDRVSPAERQPDPEAIADLVRTLEDPAAREVFLERLRTLVAAAETVEPEPATPAEGPLRRFLDYMDTAVGGFVGLAGAIVDLPDLGNWLKRQIESPETRSYWLEVLGRLAIVLAAGSVAFVAARRLLVRRRGALMLLDAPRLRDRIVGGVMATLIDLVPVGAFAIVAGIAIGIIPFRPGTEVMAKALVQASILIQVLLVLSRTVLAPAMPRFRILPVGDETAAYMYVWIRRFAYIVIYAWILLQNAVMLRIPADVTEGLERLVGLIVTALLVVVVLQNRRMVAEMLRGRPDPDRGRPLTMARGFIAGTWHIIAIVYLVSTYVIWALQIPGGFELLARGALMTIVLLAIAHPLVHGIDRLIVRALSVGSELKERYPALQARADRYTVTARRAAAGLIYALIALAILAAWGVDAFAVLKSVFGEGLWEELVAVGILLLILFAIWEGANIAIGMYLGATDEHGVLLERGARVKTLLPLLRTILFVLIASIAILTTLATLGVDVTPILAAAGVVGIAVGFGSQKLVQDVINGLFILFQNTISVGDVVQVGSHAGLVERISVRTLELRDLTGSVHTVPFSDVATVVNMTKDFSYALMDIGVSYREDVDEVMEVLKQVSAELESDPAFGQFMLEPMEILGLDQFADSAIVIRCRIKTRPIRQWGIRREYLKRLKRRFDELDIEIPFPHRTIWFGVDKDGRAPPAELRLGGSGNGGEIAEDTQERLAALADERQAKTERE